ncbi:MAG: hypothetical protein BGO01_14745 [Armatimonadetes bacterium 55-13]|nr:hypothetical protein [Armatimonadota bacterium]OJU64965.1 MAG: hypothetical protein BGO01_14745 [Armatimonadetes bacterium 55-13]
MITCHLTKLESALDQIKKNHPKLKPADAALIASSLSLTGRHAIAIYDGQQYRWPEDYDGLTKAMVSQLQMVQEGIENTAPKKTTKSAPEEEPVIVTVGLMPNLAAGEKVLKERDDLKAKLSDILQDGVEFVYSGIDIGWQWALDRANWTTISNTDLSRRIKIKASFTEGAVGIEMGAAGAKKKSTKASKAAAAAAAEPEPETDADGE